MFSSQLFYWKETPTYMCMYSLFLWIWRSFLEHLRTAASEVLHTHRNTISETASAITHLLGCNCILEKKLTLNLKISQNLVMLESNILTWWDKMDYTFKISTRIWFKKDITCKTIFNTLIFSIIILTII